MRINQAEDIRILERTLRPPIWIENSTKFLKLGQAGAAGVVEIANSTEVPATRQQPTFRRGLMPSFEQPLNHVVSAT